MDFRGQRRRSDTHVSSTDPDARLYKKAPGQAAKLSYLGHVLTENRHGLVVDVELSEANGRAEREAALQMVERSTSGRATLGADRGYDTRGFVRELRSLGVTPHVARNDRRWGRSAVDGRTTRHPGYAVSQRRRKRVEEVFGWLKTVGGGRKLRYSTWGPRATACGWSSPPRPTTSCAWPNSSSPRRRRSAPGARPRGCGSAETAPRTAPVTPIATTLGPLESPRTGSSAAC